MTDSLSNKVTQKYYQTTAGRSHVSSKDYYEDSANRLLRKLGPWLPSDRAARCLDLACGCGEMVYLLEREGFTDTSGVDLCKEEVEQAKDFVNGNLTHADILDFLRASPSQSIDFISALNILEHLPKDVLLRVLEEASRVLRTGGVLVAEVPNAISPFGGLTRHWDITHEWAFTPNNFKQLAALTGFENHVQFRECGPVPYGLISTIRYSLWQISRFFIAFRLLIELADTKGGIYTMDMLVRLRRVD